MSRISLLLHKSEVELRMSVNNNNKDIQVQVGFNWVLSHLLMCPVICKAFEWLK